MKRGVAKVGQSDQQATKYSTRGARSDKTHALIIFTKVPIDGQVKTRLTPFLSSKKSAELQKCFLLDILNLAADLKNCDVVVAYSPPKELSLLKEITGEIGYKFVPQRGRDIGERMHYAFEDVFKMEYERAVLIGTDLPSLPLRYLSCALDLLECHDICLGPNADMGYYLIGMKEQNREIFEGVDWGSDKELSQTLSRISQKGLKLACLDVWYDVDTPEDLKFLNAHLECIKTSGGKIPERTYGFLERLKL